DSVFAELGLNEIVNRPITLANTGGSPLVWTSNYSLAFDVAAPAPVTHVAKGERPEGDDRPQPQGASGHQRDLNGMLSVLPAGHVAFYDDIEHGFNGWTVQSFGPDSKLWHPTERALNSPNHAWWCGDGRTGRLAPGNAVQDRDRSP